MGNYWVTGAAGFIGFHVARRLLNEGHRVLGVDSINDYYDVALKEKRLELLHDHSGFDFEKLDISKQAIFAGLEGWKPDGIVHLAAQAGVRYSLVNPHAYIDSNITGFLNVLEYCRHRPPKHLVYASSSSVYGGNDKQPFATCDEVNRPLSLYAATKRANELMAYTYSQLYGIPMTGLRFFTVYGPWGRPDMALFLFTKAILAGEPIDVYNYGRMKRDFTYIDDIVEGVVRLLHSPPLQLAGEAAPHRLFNIGSFNPVDLLDFIGVLEEYLGKRAEKNLVAMQPGDVAETCSDVSDLWECVGFKPQTQIREGVRRFVDWYAEYYGLRLAVLAE